MFTPRIVITPGEPAGIGPDICLILAEKNLLCELIFIADIDLLRRRAITLGLSIDIKHANLDETSHEHIPGTINVLHTSLANQENCGRLDASNALYVLKTLKIAAQLCLDKACHAVVTGPVQKYILNEVNASFSGHTEFFADLCGGFPVMMLTTSNFRVALATTHLALKDVSEAITAPLLEKVITTLNCDLQQKFSIPHPKIAICGLNPHAGESGQLGTEEIDTIIPVLNNLRKKELTLTGPLPADTAFTPAVLSNHDVVLAMYHDQGLPTLKYAGFGDAVNVTLGLPIIRTSVDHGTALELAGTGKASSASLESALDMAIQITHKSHVE